MADTIHLEVVTPDGLKLAADVNEFTAPSVDGEFGVLPGHVPLLAALTTGIVTYQLNGEKHAVAVGAAATRMVCARSYALIPVVTPSRASMLTVNAVERCE